MARCFANRRRAASPERKPRPRQAASIRSLQKKVISSRHISLLTSLRSVVTIVNRPRRVLNEPLTSEKGRTTRSWWYYSPVTTNKTLSATTHPRYRNGMTRRLEVEPAWILHCFEQPYQYEVRNRLVYGYLYGPRFLPRNKQVIYGSIALAEARTRHASLDRAWAWWPTPSCHVRRASGHSARPPRHHRTRRDKEMVRPGPYRSSRVHEPRDPKETLAANHRNQVCVTCVGRAAS
jgi:hypothetical protein